MAHYRKAVAKMIKLHSLLVALLMLFPVGSALSEAVKISEVSGEQCTATQDFNALRQCARERSWVLGNLDESVEAYRLYLKERPKDAQAWLEYAQVEIWRGDYQRSKAALDHYRDQFGDDDHYRQKLARLLARAELPEAAFAINEPLRIASPDNYDLQYTHTLILRAQHRPDEMMDSLTTLETLKPDHKDTQDISRFARTPLRHHLRIGGDYYNDSDDITIRQITIDGRYQLSNYRTALSVGFSNENLKAEVGSGLETAFGQRKIELEQTWLGIEHQWTPWLWTELRAGSADIQNGGSDDTHRLLVDVNPMDNLAVQFQHKKSVYDISPRAVSLGIVQTMDQFNLQYRPNLEWSIDGQIGTSNFSDDNSKSYLVITPRRAFVRKEQFKLDLGMSGEWFGFEEDLNNGYYDPDYYRRFALTSFAHWKINDDNGLGVALSLGWHKDNSMDSYDFGEDIAVEGYFGIFRSWYLTARAGYVKRYNTLGNYNGTLVNAALMRRF